MAITQVTTLQRWVSQEVRNVYYYDSADVLSLAQLQETCDAFRNAYNSINFRNVLDDAWTFYGISARRVDVADLPAALLTPTAGAVVGDQTASVPLPTQICILASLAAPTVSPRRARTYQAGVTAASIGQNGQYGATIVNEFADFIEAVDSITVTGDTLLRVAARWSGTPPAVTAFNRLQSYIIRTTPATQRRRRIGSGI